MKLTVVVPCYNEEEVLRHFHQELTGVLRRIEEAEPEILYIDDGSADQTLALIRELAGKDDRVKYLSFSRNFGKEAAIYAGLKSASGDLVVLMDADMQDPPSLLPQMYEAVTKEGYDSVATRRVSRKGEPRIRSFFARRFYRLIHKISKTEIVDGARDFRMMNRKFVDALLEMSEYNRFSKGMFGWVGFRTKWLSYENVERAAGESKWSFWKLFFYSMDGIVNFSTVPLAFASVTGIVMCLLAAAAILFIIIRQIFFGGSAFGWPSMACIVIFIGGVQLLCIGLLGSYLSRTYLEVKHRPIYICRESNLSAAGQKGEACEPERDTHKAGSTAFECEIKEVED